MIEPRRITQKYLRRYGETEFARAWSGRMVNIQTDNGVWRVGGCGYTTVGSPSAWALPFDEAVKCVAHCGPEKRAEFLLIKEEPDVIVRRRSGSKRAGVM